MSIYFPTFWFQNKLINWSSDQVYIISIIEIGLGKLSKPLDERAKFQAQNIQTLDLLARPEGLSAIINITIQRASQTSRTNTLTHSISQSHNYFILPLQKGQQQLHQACGNALLSHTRHWDLSRTFLPETDH